MKVMKVYRKPVPKGLPGEGGHGGQGDQHDGQQNGGEAVQSAGQLAVLFLQLIQRILGVGGDVDLAGYQLGIQDGNHNGGNGDHQTDKNGQAQIRVQRTGHGDGAGGGRNQTVGGVQTAGKRGAHNGQRDVGLCSQSTADGGTGPRSRNHRIREYRSHSPWRPWRLTLLFLPTSFRMAFAMVSAAPVFSRMVPMMVPQRITMPMLVIMSPKPLLTLFTTLAGSAQTPDTRRPRSDRPEAQ